LQHADEQIIVKLSTNLSVLGRRQWKEFGGLKHHLAGTAVVTASSTITITVIIIIRLLNTVVV
jgi:hypothetical protein